MNSETGIVPGLLGMVLGFVPIALLVFVDRSVGDGSNTIDLLILMVLGIPSLVAGAATGEAWRKRFSARRFVGVALVITAGSLGGQLGGLLLHEKFCSTFVLSEQEAAAVGQVLGGMLSFLILHVLYQRK